MHKNREKSTMRQEVNRADIGGKSGNKVKDYCVTIIRCLPSQIKENSLWSLLTYRKLFTLNTKIAVEFIINSNTPFKHVFLDFMQQKRLQTV